MLGNNQVARNEKPRSEGEAQLQGRQEDEDANSNYTATTDLKAMLSKERDGAIRPSGHFRRGEPGEAPYSKNRGFYNP